MNVTYVDFDKTKPYSQKQIGDCLPQSTSKNSTKPLNSSKHQLKNLSTDNHVSTHNGKSGSAKTKNVDSEMSVSDKNKAKRQNKLLSESELKQMETPTKPSKKHKRDVQ